MLIGVISDTHDNIHKIQEAVTVFNKEAVDMVIHLGDYVAPFSLKPLEALKCPWKGVFGNNDGEKQGLIAMSKGNITEGPLRLKFAGISICAVHDITTMQNPCKADLLLHGHTHKAEIINKDGLFSVNPGECGGWLYGKSSIAVLNVEKKDARIIPL